MDLNKDGNLDIISGCYMDVDTNYVGTFKVLFGQEDGQFKKAELLKGAAGENLLINHEVSGRKILTNPFAVDWNGDGHLDLISGSASGFFALFLGDGSGSFQQKNSFIRVDGEDLQSPSGGSDPFLIDWDHDGDLDLLSGSKCGAVFFSKNLKVEESLPDNKLSPFIQIIEPGRPKALRKGDTIVPGQKSQIWVGDINNDKKWDIFLGDYTAFESINKGVGEAEVAQWDSDRDELDSMAENSQNFTPDEKRVYNIKKGKLRRSYVKLFSSKYTGRVWLFLGK